MNVTEGTRAARIGAAIGRAEETAIDLATNRVYRLRMRHPWLFGVLAFMIGGGLIAVFTMTTYKAWSYEGINLTLAFYQILFGGLGGGIAAVLLAFGYTRTIEPALVPLRDDGMIRIRR